MNKKDIVIIPSWYPSEVDPTAGIFIQQQAQSLQIAGLNISVFMVEERQLPFRGFYNQICFRQENKIQVYHLRAFTPPKRIRWLRVWWLAHWDRLMQAFLKRNGALPQLLHAHGFVGGAAARYLSEKYRIPYLITEHYSGLVGGTIPRHWAPDLRDIYTDAAEVIAVSSTLADSMSPYIEKVRVIPNMIDTTIFYPAAKQVLRTGNSTELISVGSLIPRKNYTVLLGVFAKLFENNNLHLTIIGDGPQRQDLQKLARNLHIDHAITFTGNLPPKEVAGRMRAAHLYVSTSKVESFGMALAEAMACGLPVITYRKGIAPEIINEENGKLVDNEAELVEAINFFKSQPGIKKPDHSFRLIKDRFGIEKIIKELRRIYCDLILSR